MRKRLPFPLVTAAVVAVAGAAGASPAALSRAPSVPAVSVSPQPIYSTSTLTVVMRNAGTGVWWGFYAGDGGFSSATINLGDHQANARGVIRFRHRPFGCFDGHFSLVTGTEDWLVTPYLVHPTGNQPGPYNATVTMHSGGACPYTALSGVRIGGNQRSSFGDQSLLWLDQHVGLR